MVHRHLGNLGGTVGTRELGDLRLLVSELVTNSVRHAGLGAESRIRVEVRVSDGAIRAEVSNPGKDFEAYPIRPTPDQTSGWGLYLVDQISTRWGVSKSVAGGGSSSVWFVLAAG